jgi:glyoxylase-like metal-dependent hydrolase (beta-lactamase superfamily II)
MEPALRRARDDWFGFRREKPLDGLGTDIALIPLVGHTLGHAGVAIRRENGWLLYAADAYFDRREMDARPACTPGLRFYQWLMEKDRESRLANQARLRALRGERGGAVTLFCAHDPVEFESLAGRPLSEPAPQVVT